MSVREDGVADFLRNWCDTSAPHDDKESADCV